MRIQEFSVDEGINDPHIFKAIFMAGGPGSGKSYVSGKLLSNTGLKTVNSDDIYEFLMKRQGLELDPETIYSPKGQEIRQQAKLLTQRRKSHYLDGRLGLVIDGTGKDVAKISKTNDMLKELGYDTMMLFVNTSLNVAQERNLMRPRSLPAGQVKKMWNDVQQNIMAFQQVFGAKDFYVVDNSGGLEDPEREQNFSKVYKEIQKFVNSKPSKPQARAWIKRKSVNENVSTADLDQLEKFADKLFGRVGIDVEFTRHFLDRVNDVRNQKQITPSELTRLFKQEYKRWGKPIAQMGPDAQAVMKDLQTDINLPFILKWDDRNNELDLIAKTVMRKKDFYTPDQEFPVKEDLGSIPPLADLLAIALVGQMSVVGVKALFKTAKGLNQLRKLAQRAGVNLARYIG